MKKLLALVLALALLLGVTGSVSFAEEEPTIITVAANGDGRAYRIKNEIFRETEHQIRNS